MLDNYKRLRKKKLPYIQIVLKLLFSLGKEKKKQLTRRDNTLLVV